MFAEHYITKVIEKVGAYEYSSTQLPLPDDIVSVVRRIAGDIKSSDLIKKSKDPHITLRYGLHTADPQPVLSALGGEKSINVRLGKTGVFTAEENGNSHDVVKIEVFSPELRRLNKKLAGLLPHTTTHPKYQPHITVATVKKGSGRKYIGRSDLAGKTLTIDTIHFTNRSGRKTNIELAKAAESGWWGDSKNQSYLRSAPVIAAGGGISGALLARYILAPILIKALGLDPKTARRNITLGGLGLGMVPGLLHGINMRQLKGSFFAPWGPPRNARERLNRIKWTFGKPQFVPTHVESNPVNYNERAKDVARYTNNKDLIKEIELSSNALAKKSSLNSDPMVWDRRLWSPTFPVAMSMDDISNNPSIPPSRKVQLRRLIAESGAQQGVGLTGLASPAALARAVPRIVGHTVPAAGGAWAAAKLLGAPSRLKRTAIGGALVYSALRGLLEKGGEDKSDSDSEGGIESMVKKLLGDDVASGLGKYLSSVSKNGKNRMMRIRVTEYAISKG